MRTLDVKLLRDLAAMKMQAITIALVVASGVGGFIGSLSTHDSLMHSRDLYYASSRFADVFSYARRAPEAVAARIAALPGVSETQTRLAFGAQIDMPGVAEPMSARLIGMEPQELRGGINRILLREGNWPEPGTNEVLVNEGFAGKRGLRPGDRIDAILNGRLEKLAVAGIASSPEYIFAVAEGGLSDDRFFAVIWMDRDRLAAAFDMEGAFNSLAVRLRPGAQEDATIAGIDDLLATYGSRGAFARAEQPSHKIITQEINEMRVFGTVLPAVFLAVAVFILNVVLGRLVTTQRDQIAALKALGYENLRIAAHYLKLASLIVALGIAIGIPLGWQLGIRLTSLYTDVFHFGVFEFRVAPWIAIAPSALVVAGGLFAALHAVRQVVALSPAEAMRPPSPAVYRPTLLDRLGLGWLTGPPVKMIVRSIERRPLRSLFTTMGIAGSVAILVAGTWWRDAFDYLLDVQFSSVMPADVYLGFVEPTSESARYDLEKLPGVLAAETSRTVAVRLRAGHLSWRTTIEGIREDGELRRLFDREGRRVQAPPEGLMLTDRLAGILRVAPGDTVRVEFMEGERRERDVPVVGIVREMIGLSGYMSWDALQALAGEGRLATGAALLVSAADRPALYREIKQLPRITGTMAKQSLLENFRTTTARNVLVFTTVLSVFAAAISIGVVYNSARIALAERQWELATLRVLGMTHAEVSRLLLGELALELTLAIPFGCVAGYWLAELLTALIHTETFGIPVIVYPRTYAWAILVTLVAGLLSALIVRRRLFGLDLIGVLKTRE